MRYLPTDELLAHSGFLRRIALGIVGRDDLADDVDVTVTVRPTDK